MPEGSLELATENTDNQGWIKLHRRLLDNAIIQKPKYCHLWIVLLLKAAHASISFIWNGQQEIIRPGQVLTGRRRLCEASGIKSTTLERILEYLESGQQTDNRLARGYLDEPSDDNGKLE